MTDAKRTGRGPRDVIYAVEHVRNGEWRLHIGMEVATQETPLEICSLPKLRDDFPDAKWRIAKYVPEDATLTEENRRLRAELDFQLDAVQRILYHYPDRLPGSVKATLEQMRLKAKAALAGK